MSRQELKDQAKDGLRVDFFSKMLLFIIPIIGNILGGRGVVKHSIEYKTSIHEAIPNSIWVATCFSIVMLIIATAFILVVTVGAIFNYIKIFRGEQNVLQFKNIFSPFYDGSFGKILLLVALKGIILFILMLIPIIGWGVGIYLALGWSQSTYVLFDQLKENHYSGTINVLRESATMMKGLRVNYFIYKLSFFWWYVLYAFSGGLAGFWTIPYLNMSSIAYYENIGK